MTTYTIAPDRKSITCHRCGMTSHHPQDIAHRYCGKCHVFHDDVVAALRPFCEVCGWRKGGPDSWNGVACKCGLTASPIERVAP